MQTLPALYRWSRTEYERLGELGLFEGRRVELIEGQIVEMSPKGSPHSSSTTAVWMALQAALAGRLIRVQEPLALGVWNEPEPDVAVVVGAWRDYVAAQPTADVALLVVEVADSSRRYDLGDKADVYAAAGIRDYWVVDLVDRVVVVLRDPRPDEASPTQARYAERRVYRPGEQVQPLAAGATPVVVADILP